MNYSKMLVVTNERVKTWELIFAGLTMCYYELATFKNRQTTGRQGHEHPGILSN